MNEAEHLAAVLDLRPEVEPDDLAELVELVAYVADRLDQLDSRMAAHEAALSTLSFGVGKLAGVAASILAELRDVREAGVWRTVRGRRTR